MNLHKDTRYHIYSDSSNTIIKFAATELVKYLGKVFGGSLNAEYRLIEGGNKPCAGDSGAFSFILTSAGGDKYDTDVIDITLNGYVLNIAGANDRSLLSGVYFFLEKYCGIFWEGPGVERIKSFPVVELGKIDISVASRMKYRGFYVDSCAKTMDAENTLHAIDWIAKKRGNYILISVNFYHYLKESILNDVKKRGIILEVGHHGFVNFVDPDELLDSRPGWFSLVDGERVKGIKRNNMLHYSQLCSSNKDGLKFYSDRLTEYWQSNPHIDILGIIPNDGLGWCECDGCLKLEKGFIDNPLFLEDETDKRKVCASGRYQKIILDVSEKLNRHFSDRKISFWAYHATIMPSEYVKDFPENTILSGIALYQRCYAHTLDDQRCCEHPFHLNKYFTDILGDWRRVYSQDIIIYEYYTKYVWLSKPKIMPGLIKSDIDYYCHNGINGLITMIEKDPWEISEINNNALFDYSWDDYNDIPADVYMEKHCGKREFSRPAGISKAILKVSEIMKPFGLLGGRYPHEKLKGVMDDIGWCIEEFDRALGETRNQRNREYIEKWKANLRYLRLAFLSVGILSSMVNGVNEELEGSLDRLITSEKELMEYIESIKDSGAILYSWTIKNRTGRRYKELLKLKEDDRLLTRDKLSDLLEQYYF